MTIFKSDNYYERLGGFIYFPMFGLPLIGTLVFEEFQLTRTIVLSTISLSLIIMPLIRLLRQTYTMTCFDSEIVVAYAYRKKKVEKYDYKELVSITFNTPGKATDNCLFVFKGNIRRRVAFYSEQKTKIEDLMSNAKTRNQMIKFYPKPSGYYTYDWLNKALRKYKS